MIYFGGKQRNSFDVPLQLKSNRSTGRNVDRSTPYCQGRKSWLRL